MMNLFNSRDLLNFIHPLFTTFETGKFDSEWGNSRVSTDEVRKWEELEQTDCNEVEVGGTVGIGVWEKWEEEESADGFENWELSMAKGKENSLKITSHERKICPV